MSDSIRVRLASLADVPAILELERSCATAAHWSDEQYRLALNANGSASRIVLVLATGETGQERTSGAEAQSSTAGLAARLKSCPSQNPPSKGLPPQGPESALLAALTTRQVGPEWELENIVVAPAAQRRGLGSRLMRELISRAATAGGESIFLEVRESNLAARRLYEKCGFAEIGLRPQYYSAPEEQAILYRLQLSADHSQNETRQS